MPESGDIIENYLLKERIGQKGYYIETWRATDNLDVDVVLKLHHMVVSDDYPSVNDLTDKVSMLLPQMDRLVSVLPHIGIAPWIRYKFNPKQNYLLLIRQHYPDCIEDRIPIPPTPKYIRVLEEMAKGIDFIQDQFIAPAEMAPSNLLMSGSHGYFADFGLKELHGLIENGYYGPRPIGSSVNFLLRDLDYTFKDQGTVFKFAVLYFYLRTGRYVFGNFTFGPNRRIPDVTKKYFQGIIEYKDTGKLCLDAMPNLREREIVERALATDESQRFLSCSEFMANIAPDQ